jgi:hypothetical protein
MDDISMNGSNKCQRGKRKDNILLLNINLNPIGWTGWNVRSVRPAGARQKGEGVPDQYRHTSAEISC